MAIVALCLGVLTDVLTAGFLTWYLLKLKTGHKNNDTLANKMVVYAVSHSHAAPLRNLPCLTCRETPLDQHRVVDQYIQHRLPHHLRDYAYKLYFHCLVLYLEQT